MSFFCAPDSGTRWKREGMCPELMKEITNQHVPDSSNRGGTLHSNSEQLTEETAQAIDSCHVLVCCISQVWQRTIPRCCTGKLETTGRAAHELQRHSILHPCAWYPSMSVCKVLQLARRHAASPSPVKPGHLSEFFPPSLLYLIAGLLRQPSCCQGGQAGGVLGKVYHSDQDRPAGRRE